MADDWLADVTAGMSGFHTDRWKFTSIAQQGSRGEKQVWLEFTDPLIDGGRIEVTLPDDAEPQMIRKTVRSAFRRYFRANPVTSGAGINTRRDRRTKGRTK